MTLDGRVLFSVQTPLNIEARTTAEYWKYLCSVKHPAMRGKEDIVKSVLASPFEIRQSRFDPDVYLYYGQFDKIYCVVVRHMQTEGFLITAYPTDKVKEGDVIWRR